MEIPRRDFLIQGVGLSLIALTARGVAADNAPTAFVDESGIFGNQDPFVIGIVFVPDPAELLKTVTDLRQKHKLQMQFRYNSIAHDRIPFAIDLIEYFFKRSQARFHARLIGNSSEIKGSRAAKVNEYCYHYREALKDLGPVSRLSVRLRSHWRDDTDRKLRGFLHDEIKGSEIVEVSKKDYLLQLADFFAGSIRGEVLKAQGDGKQELIKRLADTVGSKALATSQSSGNDKYVVKVVRV
jgi:Protein of unknown function (DUF3800)